MRNVMVALGSFALGAVCMSLFGNQRSTFAQGPTTGALVRDSLAVPVVPPYRGTFLNEVTFTNGSRFAVDGILCKKCKFGSNAIFEYGGGEYRLEDINVLLPVSIDLTGAARNTAQFLATFGLLGCPAKQAPPAVGPPPILRAKYAPSGTIRSLHAD
jgi:hypothetical protein